jgi:hypothetical protein
MRTIIRALPLCKFLKYAGISIDMNTLDNLNRPSQHISACSSLHQRNGALTLGRKQPRIT